MLVPDFKNFSAYQQELYDEAFGHSLPSDTCLCCDKKRHSPRSQDLVDDGRVWRYWICVGCYTRLSREEVEARVKPKLDPEEGMYPLPLKEIPEPEYEYRYSITYQDSKSEQKTTMLRPGTTHTEAVESFRWYAEYGADVQDVALRRRPSPAPWETIATDPGKDEDGEDGEA